jgi:hypothetical protein
LSKYIMRNLLLLSILSSLALSVAAEPVQQKSTPSTQQGQLLRTVYVPNNGDPVASGTALLAAVVGAPTYTSFVLDAGIYDLGTSTLTLPENASLIGKGRRVSHVRSANGTATVIPSARNVLQSLTIQNTGLAPNGADVSAVQINEFANAVRILQAELRSENAQPFGNRNGLLVTNVLSTLVQDTTVAVSGGQFSRGIATKGATGAQGMGLRIEDVRIDVSTPSTNNGATATGIALTDHIDAQIVDTVVLAQRIGGQSQDILALDVRRSSVDITGGEFHATGGNGSGNLRALYAYNPNAIRARNSLFRVTGPASEAKGAQLVSDTNLRSANFHSCRFEVLDGANISVISANGFNLHLVDTQVIARGSSLVYGVWSSTTLLTGTPGTFTGSNNSIEAHTTSTTNLGAGIHLIASNIDQSFLRVDATYEAVQGNAIPEFGPQQINLSHANLKSGAASIVKPQDWSLNTRFMSVTQPVTLEPGGQANCIASTTSSAFVANGCP